MTPGLSAADLSDIRAAEKALAEALEESPDSTAWVDCYTDDAIFVGPGAPAIEGRSAFLEAAPHIRMSSVEIVAESTLGAGDFAAVLGRGDLAERAQRPGCSESPSTLPHGLAPGAGRSVASRPRDADRGRVAAP